MFKGVRSETLLEITRTMKKFATTPNGDRTAFKTPVAKLVAYRSATLSNSGSGKIERQKSLSRAK